VAQGSPLRAALLDYMVTISHFGCLRCESVEWGRSKPRCILLLAVALYLMLLGWGLWNLQKWAILLLLRTWLPDLGYDFSPESFGLEHTADLWPGDHALFLFVGLTVADLIAFTLFANRETYRAFGAEDEAKILWWLSWGRDEVIADPGSLQPIVLSTSVERESVWDLQSYPVPRKPGRSAALWARRPVWRLRPTNSLRRCGGCQPARS
jgi:hypothetical protein